MANLPAETVSTGFLDTQKVTASFAPTGTDAKGNQVAAIVQLPQWTVDTSGVITIAPASDNLTCQLISGIDGTGTATLTAVNSKGDTLTCNYVCTVTAGVIVAMLLNGSVSAPVAK